MNNPRLTVLLISGDHIATSRISEALAAAGDNTWHAVRARRLDAGVGELKKAPIAAVMLDLFLSDSQGIETAQQLAFLKRQHCREGNGYHLGRPMSAGEFTTVLDHAKSVYPRFKLTRENTAARTALERPCLR